MKKYHLFVNLDYYPSPGLNDYEGSFENLEDCLVVALNKTSRVQTWTIAETQEDGSLKEIANSTTHIIEKS